MGQNVVFGLYLIGVAAAVFTGLVLKHTLLRGTSSAFVMELPPYHVPYPRSVLLRTWDRLKSFTFDAGKIIVLMVMVLSVLGSVGTDGSFGNEDSERSVLSAASQAATPVFEPMGVDRENWPAVVGVVTGIFAKEAVVGSLDSLYGELARGDAAAGAGADEEEFAFWGSVGEAFASVPANLAGLAGTLLDPLGVSVGEVGNVQAAAGEQGVATGTFGEMAQRFDGAVGAFAYLLFVLMYFPCAAATGAIYRETNLRWTLFAAAWTTGLAYWSAVLFYQAATFARDPASSAAWVAGLLVALVLVVAGMRFLGGRRAGTSVVGAAEVGRGAGRGAPLEGGGA